MQNIVCRNCLPSRRVFSRSQRGFSLVEITLAIGIIAFAFLAIFGLLPTGLGVFRQSMDISVGSQIGQRVLNDASQSDFLELVKDYAGTPIPVGVDSTGQKAVRFFDDQGDEIVPAAGGGDPKDAPAGLTSAQKARVIYWVNTRIAPQTVLPNDPAAVEATVSNASLATVTVQVANNPANQPLRTATNLWTGAYANKATSTNAVPMVVYSALVSRNQ